MNVFYDTHAHLDYPDFKDDLPEAIARARLAGITKIISIGTDFESSRRAIFLAEVCQGDEELRWELENLLRVHELAGSFLNSPAVQVAEQGNPRFQSRPS